MVHLTSQKIVHKDLAARNVLLDNKYSAKISDFGMSRLLTSRDYMVTVSKVGPLKWMAPECILNRVHSEASDVWSFGIVILEVLTQDIPYPDILDLGEFGYKFGAGLRPNKYVPENTPLRDLLLRCFREKPQDRPTFVQIDKELDHFKTV